jgi:hypothetical protein
LYAHTHVYFKRQLRDKVITPRVADRVEFSNVTMHDTLPKTGGRTVVVFDGEASSDGY